MHHAFGLTVVVCFLGVGAARADEQADAKALVDKAIKALGGEAKLSKFKAATTKGKGTIFGDSEIAYTEEGHWQPPGQYRFDMELDIAGNKVKQVLVFNGKKGWIKVGDNKTEDMTNEMHAAFMDYFYALGAGMNVADLKASGVKLSPLGEVIIGDRPAVGIQISRKGARDVNLYFDKETGLPAKSEITAKDVFGGDREVAHEFVFSDFKDFDGVKVYTKAVWIKDGKKYLERELTDLKPEEKLDESTFNKP